MSTPLIHLSVGDWDGRPRVGLTLSADTAAPRIVPDLDTRKSRRARP